MVEQGVECYKKLGVPPEKLVLAFPWYGYEYTCSAADAPGGTCHVQKAMQVGYPEAAAGVAHATGGRQWSANSSTPYYYYYAKNGTGACLAVLSLSLSCVCVCV